MTHKKHNNNLNGDEIWRFLSVMSGIYSQACFLF